MKAQIYRFKIVYVGYENVVNREVEVSSNYTLARLGCCVLVAFDTLAYHLFNMSFNGTLYEIPDYYDFELDESTVDPRDIRLSKLNMNIGDSIEMTYDYGCDQQFLLTLESITEMVKGSGPSYPKIIAGTGKGILDDIPPSEFGEIIKKIDRNGISNHRYMAPSGKEESWDYRDFDLAFANMSFRNLVEYVAQAFEA